MSLKYTHQQLDSDVWCPAGYYTPLKEVRLKYNNREVLYVVGQVVVNSSCCGSGNWAYALVPGYIVKWQNEKNEAGLPVTEVESIEDETARNEIRKSIQEAEGIYPVDFWQAS